MFSLELSKKWDSIQKKLMRIFLLFVFIIMVAINFSFISCAPNLDSASSTTTSPTNNNGESKEEDNRDNGDPCKGNVTCEEVCNTIYKTRYEQTSCFLKGDKQVGRLEKIYNLLFFAEKKHFFIEQDLDNIVLGRSVDVRDLEDYLEIGSTLWIEEIENLPNSNDNSRKILLSVLKWIGENKSVTEAISNVNDGDNILENLLVKLLNSHSNSADKNHLGCKLAQLKGGVPDCNWHNNHFVGSKDTCLWHMNKKDLQIKYYSLENSPSIINLSFRSPQAEMYRALSCQHEEINSRNIFTIASRNNNQVLFGMAFELLGRVCNNISTNTYRQIACKKALMCFTAWRETNGGDIGNLSPEELRGNYWDIVSEYRENLEGKQFNYNHCTAEAFGELF